MRKLLAVLILSVAEAAIAQTSGLTTDPVATSTNTVSPNAAAALASVSTNRVFIDQVGNNPNFNINQSGSGNRFGDTTVAATLRGNNITLTSIQEGNNNNIALNMNSTKATNETNITIKETGNSNSIDAACGADSVNGCNNTNLNWQFAGNGNGLQFRGLSDNINTSINVAGSYNGFYIDVTGNRHSQTVTVRGDFNSFNLVQNSTGVNGSSILVDQTGNGVLFNVQQVGNIDNVLNIRSIANGGTFNVLQRN